MGSREFSHLHLFESAQVGDTIVLVKSIDADWLKGELKGKEGIFPRSFVQVLKDPLWNTLAETERWICGAVLNLANHLFVPKEHKAREHSSQANLVVEVINQMFYYLWSGMYCSHLEAVGGWMGGQDLYSQAIQQIIILLHDNYILVRNKFQYWTRNAIMILLQCKIIHWCQHMLVGSDGLVFPFVLSSLTCISIGKFTFNVKSI